MGSSTKRGGRRTAVLIAALASVAAALACGRESDGTPAVAPDDAVVQASADAEATGGAEAAAPPPVDPETAKANSEAEAADTAEALAILKAMSGFLAARPALSYEAEVGWDAMQVTGQRLEFGSRRVTTVRRPDRARIEAVRRDGETSTTYFDGQHIWVDLPEAAAYVSIEKPGSLDDAIDYLTDDLEVPVPLGDLVNADLYAAVSPRIVSGFWVGESVLGGTRCDHVAFRLDTADAQLWIEQGERPVPHRIVITYKGAPGTPQFWARISNWNFAPDVSDARFAYTPPDGAERIPVRVALEATRQEVSGP